MKVQLYQGLLEINWNLLFSLITLIVLYLILRKFFFKKVHKFMEDRQKGVEDSLANAKKKNEEADARLAEYDAKMQDAEKERQQIITDGRAEAEAQAKEILTEANRQADGMLKKAEGEIEREKRRAEDDVKKKMSGLVISAAKRVLEESVDSEDQDAIIEHLMKEGDGKANGEETEE